MGKQQGPTAEPGNYIQYPVTNHNGKEKWSKLNSAELLNGE